MLAFLDLTSWELYYYLAAAGGVVLVVAIALYLIPGGKLKVPGIALSMVGGLGLGLALGVIFMGMMGYEPKKADSEGAGAPPQGAPPPGVMMPAMGGGGGPPGGMAGGGRGGPPGGMAGGGRGGRGGGGGPNYKQQLTILVTKLDVLTEKPLTVKLSDEQRKEVKEQLKGLADAEELSEDDAKARFEKLHDALKDQTDTLEAAGYRWPGEGGGGRGGRGGGGEAPKNPFTAEPNNKHLKELTARIDK
jgi:hypothetical protein